MATNWRPCRERSDGDGGARAGAIGHPADWLTRGEWNACYFLGLDAFHRGDEDCGACEQVAVGMRRLGEAGYRFRHLTRAPSGRWQPAACARPTGEHRGSCTALGDGSFDQLGRARRAIGWLRARAPGISTAWLEELVSLYDRIHGPEAAPRGDRLGER